MSGTRTAVGLDFGTTNTVVAMHPPDGESEVIRFAAPSGDTAAFRTVLSFAGSAAALEAGPWAIEAFLDDPEDTRLIQSFKTFAASRAFSGTSIFGKRFEFQDLLFGFLRRLLLHARLQAQAAQLPIMVGRPVVFAGADPDDALALDRYQAALARCGLCGFRFCYEPVGAAFYFARRLQGSAVVMVADFGGGTSDFSIMRFRRQGGRLEADPLSRSGVGVAGDSFDYRIIDEVISPRLGKGGRYASGGKWLPVPARYYAAFARWSQLALMKGTRAVREIAEIARTAEDRTALERFLELLRDEHGYALYQAVSQVKETLSARDTADFRFSAGDIDIQARITRTDFEGWIGRELTAMEQALDAALDGAGLTAAQVDKVFLTGGTSLVPAVRRLFAQRFDPQAIETGGEFESIASGLAEIAADGSLANYPS